jgi:D-psicose/D-tagatose/L-ribulose 3-epimerase
VCAILPPGINPISPDGVVRSKSIEHLKQCVHTAAELGAKLLGGPLFAPIGYLPDWRPTAQEWNWAVEAFASLTDLLDSYQIDLSIEPVNRSETFFIRTAADAVALCQAVNHPRMGLTIDTFHANIEEKSLADAIITAGPHLKHVHASENDRGLLGSGHVDFAGIVAALKSIGYNGYLMIEGFGYLPQVTDAPGSLWADMNVSPEQVAFSGADYLRTLL